MTPKLCKYQCGVMLDAWDDDAKKYREAGSGGLHTKERCEEMKAKARLQQGEKNHNDHGNEGTYGLDHSKALVSDSLNRQPAVSPKEYFENKFVDHTQPPKLKLKVFADPTPEGLSLLYNNFGESHNIRFSQYQVAGSLYTMAVWYEEIPLKQ